MTLSRSTFLISLFALALVSFLFALAKGSTPIPVMHLFNTYSQNHDIIISIRLPRALNAFVTGGLLALAGTLMQALLRNPLADPYILGTSGGAATISLILMLCGISGAGLMIGAWVGSLSAMLLVFGLAHRKYHWNSEHLLLIGIALASGFSALISLILFVSPDHVLRGMLFWLMGDLSDSTLPYTGTTVLLVGCFLSFKVSNELNILIRGENEASALGVSVLRLKIYLFVLTSFLTATAFSLAGSIGFIGLIVPHLFRLLCGYDHRFLIPGSVLLGGSILTFADTLSRIVLSPQEIPVGIMMALIGIPIFLFLLQKK